MCFYSLTTLISLVNFLYFRLALKTKFLSIVLLFFYSVLGISQTLNLKDKNWQIKPVYNSGFIMVHRATIGHLVKGFPSIYELNFSHATAGNKLWQLENNKPDIGVSLQCLDYKNPSQLGYAFSIVPFIDIPLKQQVKTSRLILRLCWGATYITKCFDIHGNPKNIAIGSHINAYVQFKWFWQIQLTKSLRLEPGFAFTHASNGKSRNPNLGLNVASINLGLNYALPSKTKTEIARIDSSTRVKSKNEFLGLAALGFNEKGVQTGRLYCLLLSGAYQRNIRNTHKFSIGTDFFCDQVYAEDYANTNVTRATGINQWRASVRAGYSYNVGRLSFPIEIGYYVFQKINPDANLVSRIGVRYYSASGIVAHFGLRTHFAVAYDFEYGLGYRFVIK